MTVGKDFDRIIFEEMNRDLKIFLGGGVPFGTLMGAFYSLRYGFSAGLLGGLFAGLIFGTLMFIIFGFLHSRSVKKIISGKSEKAMGVHHVRNIEAQLPYDKLFDLCVISLGLVKKCRIREENRSQGRIVAKAGINWKTWGDTISFDINRMNDGYTDVKVSSRPTARTTLVDYGKNLENVETIVSFLKKQSGTAHNKMLKD